MRAFSNGRILHSHRLDDFASTPATGDSPPAAPSDLRTATPSDRPNAALELDLLSAAHDRPYAALTDRPLDAAYDRPYTALTDSLAPHSDSCDSPIPNSAPVDSLGPTSSFLDSPFDDALGSPDTPAPPVSPCLPLPLPAPLHHDPQLCHPNHHPLAQVDVFVDDFIGVAQGSPKCLACICCILLTAVDQVFCPLEPGDSPFHHEPSSIKKMLQGDACWSTCKTILGWIIDMVTMT